MLLSRSSRIPAAHIRCRNEHIRSGLPGTASDSVPWTAVRPRAGRQSRCGDLAAVRRRGAPRRAAPPGVGGPAQHRPADTSAGGHRRGPPRAGGADPAPLAGRGRPRTGQRARSVRLRAAQRRDPATRRRRRAGALRPRGRHRPAARGRDGPCRGGPGRPDAHHGRPFRAAAAHLPQRRWRLGRDRRHRADHGPPAAARHHHRGRLPPPALGGHRPGRPGRDRDRSRPSPGPDRRRPPPLGHLPPPSAGAHRAGPLGLRPGPPRRHGPLPAPGPRHTPAAARSPGRRRARRAGRPLPRP